ncbi:hypothetical protein [Catenulispora yoronensis]|uniref:hypothetical protein n=1 Tax=Catenulispora yoronensis TaxID=450799 RepID=UPI0031DCD4AF
MRPMSGESDLDTVATGGLDRNRAALAYVCEHRDEIRQDLAAAAPIPGGSGTALLEDLAAALSAGLPVASVLDAIHNVLLDAGDVLGLYGRFDPNPRGQPSGFEVTGLPVRPPDADEVVLLCPSKRCTRSSWLIPEQQHCAFTGEALREDRL